MVRVSGRRVVFREAGTGPAALLVPGLGLSGRFYQSSYAAFAAQGFRLIVPDPPGFGGTPPADGVDDIGSLAQFFIDFADAVDTTSAAWIGHSLGAQVCLAIAARWPERASAIVLAGPTGLAPRARLSRQALGLAYEAARAPFSVVLTVARDYLRTSPRRYIGLWRRAAEDHPLQHAAALRCPCLILVGDRDRVVSRSGLQQLLQLAPSCQLAEVPGAGHALPREDPDSFHREGLRFLSRWV